MASTDPKSILTRPLLAPTTPSAGAGPTPSSAYHAPSTLSSTSVAILGAGRVLVGAATLVAPIALANAFFIDLPPSATLIGRLLGVREMVIGGLTFITGRRCAASARNSTPEVARAGAGFLRTVLWANIINDTDDIAICLVSAFAGAVNWNTALLFGGGAVAFVGLGELGLMGL